MIQPQMKGKGRQVSGPPALCNLPFFDPPMIIWGLPQIPIGLSDFACSLFHLKINNAVSIQGSGPGGTWEANMFTRDYHHQRTRLQPQQRILLPFLSLHTPQRSDYSSELSAKEPPHSTEKTHPHTHIPSHSLVHAWYINIQLHVCLYITHKKCTLRPAACPQNATSTHKNTQVLSTHNPCPSSTTQPWACVHSACTQARAHTHSAGPCREGRVPWPQSPVPQSHRAQEKPMSLGLLWRGWKHFYRKRTSSWRNHSDQSSSSQHWSPAFPLNSTLSTEAHQMVCEKMNWTLWHSSWVYKTAAQCHLGIC